MLAQRIAACFAVLVLSCTSALHASDTTFVSQGARVKVFPVQMGAKAITGNVADLASDTLVLVPEGGGEALTFDRHYLRKIEVSQGEKSNMGKGAWMGALGGAVVGTAIGAAVECTGWDVESFCTVVGLAFGVGGGALLGLGAGALIKTERWQEAEFPAQPPVALNVGRDGSVRLAFSLRL